MHFERSNERERPSLLFALNCRYSLVIVLDMHATRLSAIKAVMIRKGYGVMIIRNVDAIDL